MKTKCKYNGQMKCAKHTIELLDITKEKTIRKTDNKKPREQIVSEAINRSRAIEARKKFQQNIDEFIKEAQGECIKCQVEKKKISIWKKFILLARNLLP